MFIEFNAWEYSGSDILWAGLIKCLYNNVEEEFGSMFVRLFFFFSNVGFNDILVFIEELFNEYIETYWIYFLFLF